MSVSLEVSLEQISARISEWEELAFEASEPNPFYEWWSVIPAIKHFALTNIRRKSGVLFVHASNSLIGVLPISFLSLFRGFPVRVIKNLMNEFFYLGTPLLRKGYEAQAIEEILGWVDSQRSSVFELEKLGADGPVMRSLDDACTKTERTWCENDSFNRSYLNINLTFDEFFNKAFTGKRKKQLNKKRESLEAVGPISLSIFPGTDEPLEKLLDEFIALENSGWKGRNLSSLASNPSQAAFFKEVAMQAAERNQLLVHRMQVGNKPCAMAISFVAQDTVFECKICFDEEHHALSPGMLLHVEYFRNILSGPRYKAFDSCSSGKSELHSRFFDSERRIVGRVFSTGGTVSKGLIGVYRWHCERRKGGREKER